MKSDGGSGMAALRLVHLLRRYAKRLTVIAPLNCASAATMLALGADTIEHGAALLPDRRRHVARARSLAARPHEPAGAGEQRRGRPRDPALARDPEARRRRQSLPGALQVRPPAGDRRARPREQPVADAVPRDPRLPHEGRAQGRAHCPPAQLLLPGAPVPDHEPRGAPPRPQGPGDPRRARQPAAAAEPALLGDGPARDHRLRRGEPPRQRDHEHPRGRRRCRCSTRSRRTGTTARKSAAGWR